MILYCLLNNEENMKVFEVVCYINTEWYENYHLTPKHVVVLTP